ncbi:DUF1800 domain-containing protein [Sagittula sp. SSi028]|uniref:DUF1800 domain-containing protein n=1 Tax=Sagittula sp. SSi028 TaxID=3400636 RepID=UPI003AF9D77A
MAFDPTIADTRFGCGLSPRIAPPSSVDDMLDGVTGPDAMAAAFPIEGFDDFRQRMVAKQALEKQRRKIRNTPEGQVLTKEIKLLQRDAREESMQWMAAHILRRVNTQTPLRERLVFFWADHFTATGKAGIIRRGTSPYMQSALRPLIAGRFEDLLVAAVTHPLMQQYLDQHISSGPNAPFTQGKPAKRGMNENLAREILELHTLGADGPYTQDDVRELAELLTGLTFDAKSGRKFRKNMAEPGAETVLGQSYGGDGAAHIRDIEAALRDIANHPAVADHMAWKLAVHFLSDQPPPDLVAAVAAAWRESAGDLPTVYAALLNHPAAWTPGRRNVKPPFDFIASACRALDMSAAALTELRENPFRQRFVLPMRHMGHTWQKPDGPDGLPEEDSAWITPQAMAARLQWAVTMPQMLMPALPDPRRFVDVALGPDVPEAVRFAAGAAESVADGVGLVLASPAFQRV